MSRALTGTEQIAVYWTGAFATSPFLITEANSASFVGAYGPAVTQASVAQAVETGPLYPVVYLQNGAASDLDVYIAEGQVNWGTVLSPYKQTTGAIYNPVTPVVERAAATGPSIAFGVDGFGKLAAAVFDGTTTRTVTTTGAYNTGAWTKASAHYNDGKLSINVAGEEVASVTGAPLLTLNNANATLTIGNSFALDAPFPGSIALLKIGATVPTPEQSLWMYGQEKQMFHDGAQVTLPAATAVIDLAYDEAQDKWVALQAGNESSFTGLIRTSTATPSAGSFSKVVASGGVKLSSRITTSPGVDVTIPAYGLREELVRRNEATAKASKTLTPFDFDAVAAQTDFVLQAGWTATEVLSAGASKREGATKDFTRLYDGFHETIRFAVAPGADVWVRINARKE
ncbi:LamG domain-containing protein [Polaromonas sp. P1(28)-13]|nr:LamG domain-containing protein [Polaromonas sp. P1(28)-13]